MVKRRKKLRVETQRCYSRDLEESYEELSCDICEYCECCDSCVTKKILFVKRNIRMRVAISSRQITPLPFTRSRIVCLCWCLFFENLVVLVWTPEDELHYLFLLINCWSNVGIVYLQTGITKLNTTLDDRFSNQRREGT